MFVFNQKMFVQTYITRSFHFFHLFVWSSGIFMVWSGLPQTTPQVTTLLPRMRNKCQLTHDNLFSDHHPGTKWVFGAAVACNLTTKITSHQVWINYHAFSLYKADKSNKTASWCRNDFYKQQLSCLVPAFNCIPSDCQSTLTKVEVLHMILL